MNDRPGSTSHQAEQWPTPLQQPPDQPVITSILTLSSSPSDYAPSEMLIHETLGVRPEGGLFAVGTDSQDRMDQETTLTDTHEQYVKGDAFSRNDLSRPEVQFTCASTAADAGQSRSIDTTMDRIEAVECRASEHAAADEHTVIGRRLSRYDIEAIHLTRTRSNP